ncbi:MAG: terminase small subunit [Synergistaceae bacterium]|jgi:phage terminase small subunit|nr:terminase small subunit [Synergistaceae bacterium]
MNARQKRFVDEYLVDLNATQAAIRAGYVEKTAKSIGQENLTKPDIKNAIAAALAERSKRTGVTADRVVQELARIAFVDTRQIFEWGPNGVTLRPSDELTDDEAAIVAEVSETRSAVGGSIKAKRFDKLKALELLGRHLGMFNDKVDLKHSGSVTHTNIFDPETRALILASIEKDDRRADSREES